MKAQFLIVTALVIVYCMLTKSNNISLSSVMGPIIGKQDNRIVVKSYKDPNHDCFFPDDCYISDLIETNVLLANSNGIYLSTCDNCPVPYCLDPTDPSFCGTRD